jgi:hypothetical protein
MFSFEAETFSFCLDVLYGGLGISKLQFFDRKYLKFKLSFWSSKPDSLEMLDPDPYPDSNNPDPQLWLNRVFT